MIVTWLCLLLMSFNVCKVHSDGNGGEEVIKATKVKTTTSIKDSISFRSKRFFNFMRKCQGGVRRFLIWIKTHIQYGIQCYKFGLTQMQCRTKGGIKKTISMKTWNRIPKFLRNRWTKTTSNTHLYYRDLVDKQAS